MAHRKVRSSVVLLLAVVIVACSVPLKQKVVAAHGASVTALRAFQDAEIALYDSKQIAQLNAGVHVKIQTALKASFAAQDAAGAALQSWRSGAPVPTDVSKWLSEMEASLLTIEATLPPADPKYSTLWTQLRSWAKAGADVARMVGTVIGIKTQAFALAGGV